MQYEITDRSAIEGSRSFYDAVADGLPIDAAVAEARTAVKMKSILEWGTPVLYMRSSDGRIFDVLASGAHAMWETEEDPLRRYRESVASACVNLGDLQGDEVQRLKDLANDELRLDPAAADGMEHEVMGETIETFLERQEQAGGKENARSKCLSHHRWWRFLTSAVKSFPKRLACWPARI